MASSAASPPPSRERGTGRRSGPPGAGDRPPFGPECAAGGAGQRPRAGAQAAGPGGGGAEGSEDPGRGPQPTIALMGSPRNLGEPLLDPLRSSSLGSSDFVGCTGPF